MNILDTNFNEKLENQLQFIIEIDKIKNIMRKSRLFDHSRFENDAEHSWTICMNNIDKGNIYGNMHYQAWRNRLE